MRAPRNSALTISSRCCSPTDSADDRPVGIERQAEVAADLVEPRQPAGAVEPAALPGRPTSRFSSTRQARHQMEMLVHHADAGGQRIGRAADRGPACRSTAIVARVRRIGAEQDVHQRGLAGAVLAEQAEDLAGATREVDAVVGAARRRSSSRCRASRRGETGPAIGHWQSAEALIGIGRAGGRGPCPAAFRQTVARRHERAATGCVARSVRDRRVLVDVDAEIAFQDLGPSCFSTRSLTSAGSLSSQSW